MHNGNLDLEVVSGHACHGANSAGPDVGLSQTGAEQGWEDAPAHCKGDRV